MQNKLEKPIELHELIGKVRTDLEAARTEGDGRGVRFRVDSVELELRMTAKRVPKEEGGIKLYVHSGGALHEVERDAAQTITVRMTPELVEPDKDGNTQFKMALVPASGELAR